MKMLALAMVGRTLAAPLRVPPTAQPPVWEAGRLPDVLVVKLAEDQGIIVESGQVVSAPGGAAELQSMLGETRPRFARSSKALRASAARADPEGRLADLTLYVELRGRDLESRGARLVADARVESAFFALAPAAPPDEDIPPETPDLSAGQSYLADAPTGLGWGEVAAWAGGNGANVVIADLEYGWNPFHEDLDGRVPAVPDWGWASGYYPCHGTLVLGQLTAGDNGYGVTGLVTGSEILMASPYEPTGQGYNIASSIDGISSLMDAGDVLLIEQQAYANDSYAPVEVAPDVWDAISLAVAAGVVVVEPGGNGAADLDASVWDGWFDPAIRDSGAIMVGGGAWPDSGYEPRSWLPGGSSYGERVDLQGWYGGITTTSYDPELDPYCSAPDLFFVDADQAYTSGFGGTSGASPMVAAAAAVANSVAFEVRGEPWAPMDLRAALVETGTRQAGSEHIGPQVDMHMFLRTWGWR
ncbi:MAG: S8 family serine peptidase [Myxococcota bacterium]|nr:S8 family serine peptidase [Myxococcota bacterium]